MTYSCAEIEELIAYHVRAVLADQAHLIDETISSLVKPLTQSSDWVELYLAARELRIPELETRETQRAITTVIEVSVLSGLLPFVDRLTITPAFEGAFALSSTAGSCRSMEKTCDTS